MRENPSLLKASPQTQQLMKNSEKAADHVKDKGERSEMMKMISEINDDSKESKLEIIVESPNGSFIEHEGAHETLEETISPKLNIKIKRTFDFNFDDQNVKQEVKVSKPSPRLSLDQNINFKRRNLTDYDEIMKIIEDKHTTCLELINNAIFPNNLNTKNIENLEGYENKGADLQEMIILERIECLITQHKILEALKIVR